MHQAHAEMKHERNNHGRRDSSRRPHPERDQSEQRGRHEHGKQRQDEYIHWQRKDSDAMEINGHGESHGKFNHARDDEQLAHTENEARQPRRKSRGNATA